MRRVLHIVEYLYQGGIERLLEQLAAHTQKDTASLVFYTYQTPRLEGIAKEIQDTGVPLYCYDKPKGYDLKLVRHLIQIVKTHQIETIHTHDFGPMEYAVALKLRFPRLQLVHTHHSMHYFLRFKRYVTAFQFFSLFYDRIICVSDFVKNELRRTCPLAKTKLVTIPNGVNLSAFPPKAISLQNKPLRLVNVSRISPEKNLIHILKACKKLWDEGVSFEFHHAGSGDAATEKQLKDFIRENQLGSVVHLHGFQSDVRKILVKADIFISSSFTEGHPVAVLEAMAAGMLCLCSDIAAHRLISNDAVLFFSLDETSLPALLMKVAQTPEKFIPLGARAREEVTLHFSLERMIAAYSSIYARSN